MMTSWKIISFFWSWMNTARFRFLQNSLKLSPGLLLVRLVHTGSKTHGEMSQRSWKMRSVTSMFWPDTKVNHLFIAKPCRGRTFPSFFQRFNTGILIFLGHNHICSLQLPIYHCQLSIQIPSINVPFFSRPWGQWLPSLPPDGHCGSEMTWQNCFCWFHESPVCLKICTPETDTSLALLCSEHCTQSALLKK